MAWDGASAAKNRHQNAADLSRNRMGRPALSHRGAEEKTMRNTLAILTATSALLLAAPLGANAAGTGAGAVGGAVAGAAVGGPVGAAVGGVIGAIVGTAIDPPPAQIVSYVEAQPAPPPVMLQGNLAVGATLPPAVTLYPVPQDVYVAGDARLYAYAFINGQRVIVDPQTHVVIGIVG
jgi:hypothetical protein